MRRSRRVNFKNGWLVLMAISLASCNLLTPTPVVQDINAESDDPFSRYSPLVISGEVVTAGSSTLFPLSERMAERFRMEGFDSVINVDSIGSGAGFERFCTSGEIDISNASRRINMSEIEDCRSIDRKPIEFRVATDALVVAVSWENDFADDVTLDDLATIFSSAETWSDVRAGWPAEPIQRFVPGTDSGTFDYFVEQVFDKNKLPILDAENVQLSEDDNVLVQGILGSPYAVGFFGYAYYAENQELLNVLSIEGIGPTQETVDAATYPLARPLLIYSDAGIMNRKPQVAAFVLFYIRFAAEEAVDVGYFPSSQADREQALQQWFAALGLDAD